MRIISRAKAKEKGLTKYFTGQPCKHGHVCERFVHKYQCIKCKHERDNKRRINNPEKSKEANRKYRVNNPDKMKEQCRKRREAIKKKRVEKRLKWIEANPEQYKEDERKKLETKKIKLKQKKRRYRLKYKEKLLEKARKRRIANPEITKKYMSKFHEKAKRNDAALDALAMLANLSKLKEMETP